MIEARIERRFFESTRGQIVDHLRSGNMTVNELAAKLGLTDNAVRAHLLTLERDRLVEQKGTVKGFRKPHVTYGLTTEAHKLYPKSYDSLFNQLVEVLKARLAGVKVRDLLLEVGQRLGKRNSPGESAELNERLASAAKTLESLGGAPKVVQEDDRVVIASSSCPFAEAVAEHPEVCQAAEAMVTEIVGQPVRETCDRSGTPKCRFEIETKILPTA
jgi:predicted ArsR family transcriptional regulator